MNGFSFKKINGLTFLTCDALSACGITHGFTTRLGGVSKGPFDSLNLSYSKDRDDSAENVRENYDRVIEALGYTRKRAVITNQTHSTTVKLVCENMLGTGFISPPFDEGVDATVCGIENSILSITVADCTPILFFDKRKRKIAAAHSGWKGTLGKISHNTIQLMSEAFDSSPDDIIAVIGPSIGPCCYEVGKDLFDRFKEVFPENINSFFLPSDEKFYFDIWKANRFILLSGGIREENLFCAQTCTCHNEDLFFSYRRQKQQRGSMAALIGL